MNKTEKMLAETDSYRYTIIFEGIFVGLIGGLIVSIYRLLLAKIFDFSQNMYSSVNSLPKALIMFSALTALGCITGLMVKTEPLISGSGIPQVEGVLLGKMRFKWFRVLILKFLGGLICLGSGMSLGREGPSIQIGAVTGIGISRFLKRPKTKERYLLTFGAAAGLAAAFNAPFAAVLFVMEELHKSFNKYLFIGGMTTGITADMVSKFIFGSQPVFKLGEITRIPYRSMYYVVIAGIGLGFMAVIFNKCIIFFTNHYDDIFKLPYFMKQVPAFIFTGIIALTLPQLLGGGHNMIEALATESYGLNMLLLLLIVKFCFTQFCFSSGAPGGIFLPLLTIGALTGAVFTMIFVKYFSIGPGCMGFFIAISLAGFFGAVTKAPVTGIILVCEMTGSFSRFLFLSVVTIVAFVVTEIFRCKSVYEMLLNNSLRKVKEPDERGKRVMIEIPVDISSYVVNKAIRELKIPKNLLLVSIKRGLDEVVPRGDVIIRQGDELVILLYECDLQFAEEYFTSEKAL